MSLAKRNNGCQECRIRRVSCDKAQPECAKCRRKGISCSGQGVEYRFSTYMSDNRPARKNNAAKPHSPQSGQSGKRTSSQPLPNTAASSTTNHYENASSKDCQILQYYKQQQLPGISISNPAISESNRNPVTRVQNINSLQYYMQPLPDIGPIGQPLFGNESETYSADENELHWDILSIPLRPAIEIVPAQSRMLFDHFAVSNFVASKMVVLDSARNGYRQLILPMACDDDLVKQAVSVVAAFHISSKSNTLKIEAEMRQQQILTTLRHSSSASTSSNLSSLSAWTTILVLLVGDTITGSNNYVYLLELLSHLARSVASDASLPDSTRRFVVEQTRMFELFGFPLASQKKGLEMLQHSPDYYLDFMTASPEITGDSDNSQKNNVMLMTDAIRQAYHIYKNRVQQSATPSDSFQSIEKFCQTIRALDPNVNGRHSLVWACFVAAAESVDPTHRTFLYARLESLFECTRFGTIPLALDTLQYIWDTNSSANWTEVVTTQRQALIM